MTPTLREIATALAEFLPLAELPSVHSDNCATCKDGLPELMWNADHAAFHIGSEPWETYRQRSAITALRLMHEHQKCIWNPTTKEAFQLSPNGDRLVFSQFLE